MNREMRLYVQFMVAVVILLSFGLAGCGSGTSAPSGFKNRVFVSNATGSGGVTPVTGVTVPSGIQIINANNDVLSPSAISVPGAAQMASANGITVVVNSTENDISIVTNSNETVGMIFGTLDRVSDLALTPNGATAFAAVRNPGVLDTITTSTDVGTAFNIPTVSRVVMSPQGTKLLVFADDPQTLVDFPQNSFFVIDVASNTMTTITRPNSCTTTAPVTCDQPFTAVFNNSETQAFILNCGAECGGTAGSASVVSLDFSGATPVFGNPISVSGATVGLLSNSSLFVAGTPPGGTTGTLQLVNPGNGTVGATVNITDGTHTKMVMASNNRLYVGASGCTTVNDTATGMIRGCLTIFNTSSSALVFPEFNSFRTGFDVTGIQPIANRTVVYVAEGGSLDIYDTTTDQLAATQVDIIGQAVDVVQVDQ